MKAMYWQMAQMGNELRVTLQCPQSKIPLPRLALAHVDAKLQKPQGFLESLRIGRAWASSVVQCRWQLPMRSSPSGSPPFPTLLYLSAFPLSSLFPRLPLGRASPSAAPPILLMQAPCQSRQDKSDMRRTYWSISVAAASCTLFDWFLFQPPPEPTNPQTLLVS